MAKTPIIFPYQGSNTIALVDNSIGQRMGNGAPVDGSGNTSQPGDLQHRYTSGYMTHALAALDGQASMTVNSAVGGDFFEPGKYPSSTTVEGGYGRILRDVCGLPRSSRPAFCIVGDWENSIKTTGTYDETALFTYVGLAIQALARAGVRPVVRTAIPLVYSNAAVGTLTAAVYYSRVLRLNEFLRRLPLAYPSAGVIIADTFKAVIDPVRTTDPVSGSAVGTGGAVQPKQYYIRGDDLIHPTDLGAWYMGQAVADAIRPFLVSDDLLPTCKDDNYSASSSRLQLVNDPLITTTTGGTNSTSFTGTVPSGHALTISGTPTGTVTTPARSDGYGNNVQLNVTGAAAANDYVQVRLGSYIGRVTPGVTTVEGLARVEVSGLNNISGISMWVEQTSTGQGTVRGDWQEFPNAGNGGSSNGYTPFVLGSPQVSFSRNARTGPMLVLADATALYLTLRVYCGAPTCSATVAFGRLGIRAY